MNHALPLLIDAAEAARDQHAARGARARQAVAQANGTLQRLQDFRVECLARSAAGTLGRTHGAALQDHQRFVAKLDEAIGLQAHEVRRCEQHADQLQGLLQRSQQRVLALHALRERQARTAAARATRREQRDADEFAARAYTQLTARAAA